jgi:perosamine synthetase
MNWEIPLFKIYWDEEDIEAVTNIIKKGTYWATGPQIKEFAERIAEYVETKYAVAFNSGTSALHAILMAYDIKEGDEVIVPSLTFISTANATLFVGAKPVFAEIEDTTYGLDLEDVRKRITNKTRAIIPVHYGGCPCLHIKELKQIAEENNLLLIEDAAAALGAKIGNEKVGTFGDAAMFSFCQSKIISTGEGGIIVTDSKEIYEKLKLIVSHGRAENADYFSSAELMDYIAIGYNFRMPTMNAALGISQLKKIDRIIDMRRKNAEHYTSNLIDIDGIKPWIHPDDFYHVYWIYTVEVENGLRDNLKKYLADEGISSKLYYDQIHLTRFYKEKFRFKEGDLPVTGEICKKILSLPMYPTLTKEEINYITEKIDIFLRREREK